MTTTTWSRGWYVEIDHPDGQTLSPSVVSDPQWNPKLNGLPTVTVPVKAAPRWEEERSRLEGQPMRLYYDGHQLPIDELQDVQVSPDRAVLTGKGALELDDYAEGVEYIEKDSHLAAEDIITTHTSYAANVDDPTTNTRNDVRMLSADSPSDWRDALQATSSDSDLWRIGPNGKLKLKQTGYLQEAEATSTTMSSVLTSDYSGDEALKTSGTDQAEWDLTPDLTIPTGDGEMEILLANPGGNHPAFEIQVDGNVVESVPEGALSSTASSTDLQWSFFQLNPNSALNAGTTYTITFKTTTSTTDELYLDVFFPHDTRTTYNFDSTPSNGIIDGPELYPTAVTLKSVIVSSVEKVAAGKQTGTWNDISGAQAIAVRNDTTDSTAWVEATNSESVDADFASATQEIQTRWTIDRWGSQSKSPRYGFKTQEVDLFDLYADLKDTPVLLDFAERGKIREVLNLVADSGTFIWYPRWDPTLNNGSGGYAVEWTQSGQRTAERAPELVDWGITETIEDSYEKVVVFGAGHNVDGEVFSNSEYDRFEGLGNANFITGSETVYNPSDGTVFERNTDYEMLWSEGAISLLSSGSMSTGTTYEIDYRYKSRGEYTIPDASTDPPTLRKEIASAATDRQCDQIALGIAKEVQDPLVEVEAEVSTTDPRLSLVEALSHPELPLDGPLVIRSIEFNEQSVTLYLGSRESIRDIVDAIRDRVIAVTQRA